MSSNKRKKGGHSRNSRSIDTIEFGLIGVDENISRAEKAKARELRKTQWWRTRISKGTCHYCGRCFPPRDLTMDHVVPLARGGKSTKGNLVPSCRECNTAKKVMLPLEWEEHLARLEKSGDEI